MIRIALISITIFLFSCSNYSENQADGSDFFYPPQDALELDEALQYEVPRTAEPPPPPEFDLSPGSKVIRNGYMQIEVTNLANSKSVIDSLLKTHSAHYENEKYTSFRHKETVNIVIRIPTEQFYAFILALENGDGTLIQKNITMTDVTEDYVDNKLRLENKLSYLKQYKHIMSQATTIKDMLAIQNEVRILEEEIESKKSRLAYYDNEVNYSTLDIDLEELVLPANAGPPNLLNRVSLAFITGFEMVIYFFIGILYLWPIFFSLIAFILMRKRLWRMVS